MIPGLRRRDGIRPRTNGFWIEVGNLLGRARRNELKVQYNDGLLHGDDLDREVARARPIDQDAQLGMNANAERQRRAGEGWARHRAFMRAALDAVPANRRVPMANWANFGEPQAPLLDISLAPHIGDLRLNLKKEFPNGNSLSFDEFVDGEELVRLQGNNKYVFKINDLQTFFNTRRKINPLTNLPITQNDIERFRYVEDLTLGGRRNRRRKTRRKMNKRKTRRH